MIPPSQKPSDYARGLFAVGKTRPEVVAALVEAGYKPGNAEAIAWAASQPVEQPRGETRLARDQKPVSLRLARETYASLCAMAKARGLSKSRLASLIIEAVIDDNLVAAVLDDGGAS